MILRRRPLIATVTALLAVPGSAFSQTADRVWRIGYLSQLPGPDENVRAFVEALRSLGYV